MKRKRFSKAISRNVLFRSPSEWKWVLKFSGNLILEITLNSIFWDWSYFFVFDVKEKKIELVGIILVENLNFLQTCFLLLGKSYSEIFWVFFAYILVLKALRAIGDSAKLRSFRLTIIYSYYLKALEPESILFIVEDSIAMCFFFTLFFPSSFHEVNRALWRDSIHNCCFSSTRKIIQLFLLPEITINRSTMIACCTKVWNYEVQEKKRTQNHTWRRTSNFFAVLIHWVNSTQ